MTIKVLNALIAVVAGVAGAVVVYYLLNKLAELLPGRWEDRVKPYLYLLPALAVLGLYLIYPTIQTFVFSFANNRSTEFVFDGSDQMPGEVGSGSFWREMTAWISGGQEIPATLENIESSWPA